MIVNVKENLTQEDEIDVLEIKTGLLQIQRRKVSLIGEDNDNKIKQEKSSEDKYILDKLWKGANLRVKKINMMLVL